MLDWNLLLNHILIYGTVYSFILSIVILVSLRINPEMWLQDYPPDVQEAWGPISEKGRKQRNVFGVFFFAMIIGGLVWTILDLYAAGAGSFLTTFIVATAIFMYFNLVDAIIIDWLILLKLWPSLAVLPGTEGMVGYSDIRFWTVNLLKGTIFSFVAGLLTAGLAVGIQWIGTLI